MKISMLSNNVDIGVSAKHIFRMKNVTEDVMIVGYYAIRLPGQQYLTNITPEMKFFSVVNRQ